MLKKITSAVVIVTLMVACSQKEVTLSPPETPVSIIPAPVAVSVSKETVSLVEGVTLMAESTEEKQVADFLKGYLAAKKINTTGDASAYRMIFRIKADTAIKAEGYTLAIGRNETVIEATDGAGLFYGTQSLMQLLGAHGTSLPMMQVKDYPRFSYRGLHLDVGRHMFPPAFIKKYIDLLAHHKMNRFHWHLTEDQGWRIEIKKYPKLQEIGAFRKETVIGHARTAERNNAKSYDGKRYGGYYTQEEVKEIVQYAKDRYVTVIPEIELPGHALAALSAYPELGCTGGPYEAATTWGVFDDVFCAGKEETFQFLENVLDEVFILFPTEYVHIGGDECPKTRWKACPHCQKRMKAESRKDEHELQSYFIQRIEKFVNSKGRRIIGWDEILEGGLAENATVMSWRGEEGGIAAARQKHDVIMTPGNWCYFDHYQDSSKSEPLAIGGFTDVREVYGYEPVPSQLNAEEAKHILGAQANVWTEYMPSSSHVEYMVYPRASAIAEVLWSPRESRNYDQFIIRLREHANRLKEWDVNYATHALNEKEKVGNSGSH